MRYTNTLLTVLFTFFCFWGLSNNDPITLQLEQPNARFPLSMNQGEQTVELCGLKSGKTYWLRAVSQENDGIGFVYEGDLTIDLMITPEGDCEKILLLNEAFIQTKLVLSVSCVDCEVKDESSRMANLAVSGGASALELIQDVFIGGDCFEIQNAAFIGNQQGIGTFANGGASIGLDNGVIISSGNINNAPGPNNQGGAGNNMGAGSHPDLAQLANAPIFDATGISFQFTPTVPQIFFNYVFASEEYCEYVGAGFNDVFGFFISGPGINGSFLLSGENIAVIPGTSTAVAIDEVNQTSNTGYFVGNSNSCGSTFNMTDIQFDGFTTTLTAVANVQPCETYFIRLLVGDSGDGIFDSAVFLEANSFNAGGASAGEAISPTTGSNITYEACSDGYFVLQAAGDINTDRVIEFNLAPFGTATWGVDYAPFPLQVTVPAGQTEVIIPITVFPDNIIEGQETIVLELENSCSCSGTYIELIIEDVPPLEVEAFDIELCDGLPGQLDALTFGGLPGYNYSWSDGQSGPTISVSPTETTVYAVTVTDECGQQATSTAIVTVNPPASAQMVGGGQFCGSDISTQITITFGGLGPWLFSYSKDGEFQEPIYTEENPYILEVSEAGFYFPESVISVISLCEGTVEGLAFVEISDFEVDVANDDISCAGEEDGTITATAMNGVTPYSYSWENLTTGTPIAENGGSISDLPAGTYSVTVNDNDGCLDSTIVEILEPESMEATASIGSVPNCYDNNGGSIDLTVDGGTPGFSYLWSSGDTIQNPVNLPSGDYTVTVTDASGCEATEQATVGQDYAQPDAVAAVSDTINCYQPTITLSGAGSSSGAQFATIWSGPGVVGNTNTLTPNVNAAGTYILSVTNVDNGCVTADTIEVLADLANPVAIAEDGLLNCYNPEITLNADGSSEGNEFTYQWAGPGILGSETILNPLVFSPGSYTLIVTDESNGCEESVTVSVLENKVAPTIDAGTGAELDCFLTEYVIPATASGNVSDFVYEWTTIGGNIITGSDELNPEVDAAGSYQLVVTDTLNGCSSTDNVSVTQDPSLPVALVDGEATLTCNVVSIDLDASNSTVGSGGSFEWFTNDGNFISGQNTLTPSIDAPGTYYLVITGGGSVCEDTAVVIIPIDTISPAIIPATEALLTCDITEVQLSAQASINNSEMDINWFGPAGLTIVSPDSLTITAVNPGPYTLVVNDLENGCISSTTTVVNQDIEIPAIDVAVPLEINCGNPQTIIDASSSSSGNNFNYQWSAPDGSILTETSSTLANIDEPGEYILTIENTDNGCVDNTTITIEENINYPILSIDPAELLTCVNVDFDLNASATSTSGGLLYQWSTTDGAITTGGNTPTPTVNEPGLYTLQVTDVSNDCVTTETVTVNQDINAPVVDAGVGTVLTCTDPDYTLSGTVITSGGYDVTWSTTDGSIQSGANTLTPFITSAGTYILQATDQSNGCVSTNEVTIIADNDIPVIDIAATDLLDCITATINIDATASDNGPEYVYNWTDSNGNTLGNTNMLSTSTPGTFILEITNTTNGCTNTETATVDQDIIAPTAEAGPTDIVNCYNPTLTLNAGSSSQGSEFTYQWTTADGLITVGGNTLYPTIAQAGTYELVITNTNNNCTSTDVVAIQEDLTEPNAQIATPEILDCATTQTTLNSTGSSTGSIYNYQWTTSDGNILSGNNGTSPVVDDAGTYMLEIINTVNGCVETTSITVEENIDAPIADAGLPQTLTCAQTSLNLDATASSQGGFNYQWNGPGIVSGNGSLTPVVDIPGVYEIVVTNLTNSCTAQDAVIIDQDIVPPTVSIASPLILNCTVLEQELDATATSQGPDFEYSWTASNNGNILQGNQSLTPLIDEPGTYELVVLNTDNGCSSTESIDIIQDIVIPEVANAAPEIINCNVPEITIDASASSTGSIYAYQWSSNDGNILQGANTLTPVVNENGTYELLITNIVNECTNTLLVDVEKDIVAPVAEAGQSQILNCVDVSLNLDASNSSTGGIYIYQWDGPGLVTGANTLSPQVDEPGIYSILVTNISNGCTSTDAVIIQQDIEDPVAVIASPQILNCQLEAQTLDALATNQGAIFEYQWSTTSTGNIVSGDNTLTPLIDEPGSYTLFVTNTQNGCTDETEVVVSQDITIPDVGAEEPEIITCEFPSIVIDGSASSAGTVYTYSWTTSNGNIVSGASTLTPEVDEGGEYELLITNTSNFCTNTLLVNVDKDIEAPIAEAGQSEILNCTVESLSLDGSNSSTGDFSYQWEGPGLLSGETSLTPFINEPGLYTLLVTNNFNGCESEDFVLIEQDIAQPTAQIEPSDILNCLLVEQQLDGTATNQGTIYEYEWTTSGTGNIVEGANTLTPLIDQPGTYILLVTNTENGCTDTEDITVSQDIAIPLVGAEEPAIVTCAVPQIEIDATASSLGNNFEYLWTTSNGGNITEGANTLTPVVDEGGLYLLLITNTTNHCTNTLEVEVEKDVEHPDAEAGPTQELNCDIGVISIDGDGSSLGDFSYQWEGPGLTDVYTLSIQVDEPGTYQLTVTNNFNGCSSTDEVVITQDIAVPVPDILLPEILTCATQVVSLDATNSSQAPTIVYEWTTANGNIVSGEDELVAAVNQPGEYTLNIYDEANECENSLTIDVEQDIENPVANAGDDYLMDCWQPTDELDGNGSSAGPEFTYEWSTSNGRIISGENTLTPVIDAAGMYSLLVTDMDNGCADDDNVLVSQTYPATSVQVEQPPCYGDPGHIFVPEVIGGTAPFVYSIDGGNDYFTGGNFTNLEPGNYDVVVQDVNGCEYETTVSIEQPDSMVVLLTVDETEIQFGEAHQIVAQVNIPEDEISQINWTNGSTLTCDDCLLPVAQPFYTTDYRLDVVSIHGCEDRAFLRIFVDRQKSVYAPNIFSPNGDGANDRFYLFAKQGSVEKIKSFGIFNRWGEPVFEAFNFQPNDPTYGWDGFFRGQLMNSAVFVWYAEIEFVDGTVEIFEGDVTLFR